MISGVVEILLENASLISELGEDKIFPLIVPEETESGEKIEPPYLAVMMVERGTNSTKSTTSRVDFPIVQVNIYATSYDELETLEEAVREALEGFSGTTGTGHNFHKINFLNSLDRPDLYQKDRPSYPRSSQYNCIVKR